MDPRQGLERMQFALTVGVLMFQNSQDSVAGATHGELRRYRQLGGEPYEQQRYLSVQGSRGRPRAILSIQRADAIEHTTLHARKARRSNRRTTNRLQAFASNSSTKRNGSRNRVRTLGKKLVKTERCPDRLASNGGLRDQNVRERLLNHPLLKRDALVRQLVDRGSLRRES